MALATVTDTAWRYALERSVFLQAHRGVASRTLPELSLAASESRTVEDQQLLARLRSVPLAALTGEEWLTHRILEWTLEMQVEGRQYYWLEFAVLPYQTFEAGPVEELAAAHDLATAEGRQGYLSLLDAYTRQLGERLFKTREQARRGIRIPKPALPGAVATYRSLADQGAETLRVSAERLQGVDGPTAYAFRRAVDARVDAGIKTAMRSIAEYLDSGEYKDAAPTRVGLAQYPQGREYYRYLVRLHTTLRLTPEEVFAYGEKRMAELDTQMKEVRRSLGFSGSHGEFAKLLRREPRLRSKTPDELGAKYLGYVERIRPRVGELFAQTPKAPFGVRRLDPAAEAGMTFGYYQAPTARNPRGEYFFNASRLEEKTTLEVGKLIYHELVPGHHFQVSRQMENESLPLLRREALDFTAYSEGWADYAAVLATEMGLLDDPYDRYGDLTNEAFTVARLVLDTGLNYFGWPPERAAEYFRQHAFISEAQIGTEVLRYSTDIPGQALGYRIGQRHFEELRARARRELGMAFDIRAFHEQMIGSGAMPLGVLTEHLERFLARQKAAPTARSCRR